MKASAFRLIGICLGIGLFVTTLSADPIYRLKSHEDPNMCLDVQGNSTSNNANVQVHPCHNGNNQRWEMRDVPGLNNFFVLEARHSGRCLDVKDASHSNHANVQQYTCYNNHSNQEWEMIPVGSFVGFRNRQSSKCLDVRQNPYGNVQQYDCHYDNNQLWILDFISDCGNNVCETGENQWNCSDCAPVCGNGTCELGESCTSCSQDCACVCGDGVCNGSETSYNCPLDCWGGGCDGDLGRICAPEDGPGEILE